MALSDLQLTEYIQSLNLNDPDNIDKYNLFAKLMVLSNDLFLEVIEMLINGEVLISSLLELTDYSESAVRAYIEQIKGGGEETALLKKQAKELIKGCSNYATSFESFVRAGIDSELIHNDFQHYIVLVNQLYGTISAYASIDEYQVDSSQFFSYDGMNLKFLAITSNDVIIQETKEAIKNHALYTMLPKTCKVILKTLESAEHLVNTNKVSATFRSKPLLVSLLKGLANYGSYAVWGEYLDVTTQSAAIKSKEDNIPIADALWQVVMDKQEADITILDNAPNNFFDNFLIYQAIHYYFPNLSVFNRYRDTTINSELNTILHTIESGRTLIQLFQLLLQRIVAVCNASLTP